MPNYSNRRGISVTENFVGCLEEFVFNGVHIIRDIQRSLLDITDNNKIDIDNIYWDEALGYPKRNPVIWWGPAVTQNALNISGLDIGGSGRLGTECPSSVIDNTVLTFPDIKQFVVFLKIERDGGSNSLQFEFGFRTLNLGGILFYHTIDKDLNFVSVSFIL